VTPRPAGAGLAGIAFLLAAASLAPAAQSQPATVVRDLPHRREVLVPSATPGDWLVVTADSLLMVRCAEDFSDVRLVDEFDHVRSLPSLPPRRDPHIVQSWQCSSDRVHWQDCDSYRHGPAPTHGSKIRGCSRSTWRRVAATCVWGGSARLHTAVRRLCVSTGASSAMCRCCR
jgi:hypothetical protein